MIMIIRWRGFERGWRTVAVGISVWLLHIVCLRAVLGVTITLFDDLSNFIDYV